MNMSPPQLERSRVKSRLAVAWRMDSSGCCSSACIRPRTTCLIMLSPRPSRPPHAPNTQLLSARWYWLIQSQSRSLHVLAQLQSGLMSMSHHSAGGGAVRHDCVGKKSEVVSTIPKTTLGSPCTCCPPMRGNSTAASFSTASCTSDARRTYDVSYGQSHVGEA